MDVIAAFLTRHIVYIYFFYGLAFFALGLVLWLEGGRASEFRFARALHPLALFAFVHGIHEWFEMFQIFAAHEAGYTAGPFEEAVRVAILVASFAFLIAFDTRLLPRAEEFPRAGVAQLVLILGVWAAAVGIIYLRQRPALEDLILAADVLARYILGITGAVLAAWALLRERRDFHLRGMSAYGKGLLWAALAFFIYGVIGQLFVRPSIVAPSQVVNTALFVRLFGFPVQLLRGGAAVAIAVALGSALRAFEAESRLRLARANKARLEAQAAALEAQARRVQEVEALNVQLRNALRDLSAMVEMSRTLSSTIELDRVLHFALYQITNSFDSVRCAAIFLRQAAGALAPVHIYYQPHAAAPAVETVLQAIADRAAASGQAAGRKPDGQIVLIEEADTAGGASESRDGGCYDALGVPLMAQGAPIGSLVMAAAADEGRSFTERDLNLFAAFARQIVTSIENARLYRAIQEREARLTDLFQQLVHSQEQERQRIARELHDETGQKLTALAMGLAAVETGLANGEIEAVRRLTHHLRELSDQAVVELRRIMSDLRPALLDDLGLTPALRSLVQQFAVQHPDLQISLTADRQLPRLTSECETVLYRVAQEALTNIGRHARATRATVTLAQRGDYVRLEISDNGIGFDPNVAPRYAAGGGLGLAGMRERVALVGGRWSIHSAPGQGTQIAVELPLATCERPSQGVTP
ncbi:MAG: histidine kinase [Anaerolineae bacterium]|nr:histidine kinase [Anaerolineae bacterium]